MDPNRLDLPTGEMLAKKDLANFKNEVSAIKQEYASLNHKLKFASND